MNLDLWFDWQAWRSMVVFPKSKETRGNAITDPHVVPSHF